MKNPAWQFLAMLVLLCITTLFNYHFFSTLSLTGVTLIYLLAVVSIAYSCESVVAFSNAVLAFLVINYFFTEPRYTLEVASIESLTSLFCFLVVSLLITSLVKQLKVQTQQSELATRHAQFARVLAENLALATDASPLLQGSCQLLQAEFKKPFAIALAQQNGDYIIHAQSGDIMTPDKHLLQWVSANGKPISPYTDYWSHSAQWLFPLSRSPNQNPMTDPVLIVGNIESEDTERSNIEIYTTIKSCVDQISLAYQRLINIEKLKSVELAAKTEAIQNTLLASISHDMRTPLTSILGAATALQQSNIAAKQRNQLTDLIASQAQYLATTTENILSLIRLESSNSSMLPMDWQSPEELIGVVTALYKNRSEPIDFEVNVKEPDLLIKANASLITQALVNLIDNAKQSQQYASHSSLLPEAAQAPITIEVSKIDNRINIYVLDRGTGLSKPLQEESIKKFTTTKPKGLGLGLSIVKAIAKAHNATFTIQNRAGGGACATLSFFAENLGNVNVQS